MSTLIPPDDPEEWTDEQWIAYLNETDPEPAPRGHYSDGVPKTLTQRAAESSPGTVLGAAMLGLGQIFYGDPDKPTIVEEAPGGYGDDEDFEVELDAETRTARVYFRERSADGGATDSSTMDEGAGTP